MSDGCRRLRSAVEQVSGGPGVLQDSPTQREVTRCGCIRSAWVTPHVSWA